ncbi:hypothetical protein ANABIO32_13920 [Rossellomorea marisflavi]|nr:hypothetical protein ANABIO32_13920 [Rossellomorea marisflavi]
MCYNSPNFSLMAIVHIRRSRESIDELRRDENEYKNACIPVTIDRDRNRTACRNPWDLPWYEA